MIGLCSCRGSKHRYTPTITFVPRNEPAINIEVVARHPPGAKPLFKSLAAFPSAECRNPSHGRRGFVDVAHNITGLPAFYNFGDRTVLESDDRRAARQCFNHHESEGLRP